MHPERNCFYNGQAERINAINREFQVQALQHAIPFSYQKKIEEQMNP
jgi:hypothetical protein